MSVAKLGPREGEKDKETQMSLDTKQTVRFVFRRNLRLLVRRSAFLLNVPLVRLGCMQRGEMGAGARARDMMTLQPWLGVESVAFLKIAAPARPPARVPPCPKRVYVASEPHSRTQSGPGLDLLFCRAHNWRPLIRFCLAFVST